MRTEDLFILNQSTPYSIIAAGSGSTLQWCRGDSLNTVTTLDWFDKSAAGKSYTQATGSKQPVAAADATINGRVTLTFDGVDDEINCAGLSLPAPATTPTFFWAIIKQITWTLSDRILSNNSGTDSLLLFQSAVTPALRLFNGSGVENNTAAVIGNWVRVWGIFTGSTSDQLKVGATLSSGTSAGNSAPSAGRNVGGINPGTPRFANVSIAELLYSNSLPNAAQLAAMDAYAARYYGSAVAI